MPARSGMLTKILAQAKEFDYRCRTNGSGAWFRGHRLSEEWQLKSTLHRHVEEMISKIVLPLSHAKRLELLRSEYQTVYRTFVNEAWPLLKPEERSEWGVIFTMQHYGLPTRLLDWTESFACALFFAHLNRSADVRAAVWALDPLALNEASL